MYPIRKRLVTDEAKHPIAVQIDYADWLKIKQLLKIEDDKTVETRSLSYYAGTIELTEDPLEFQARIRNEWQ